MARLLQIAELGQPILRKSAEEVADVSDSTLQELIDDMIETVVEVDGVGIAAPQVLRSLRVFIIASRPNARYPRAPSMEPLAMINPKILSTSEEKEKGWEGCLSFPGARGMTPRYTKVEVSFTNRKGERQTQTLEGFIARIFQHEFDHLDGKLFIDRMDSSEDFMSEKEYQRMMKPKE